MTGFDYTVYSDGGSIAGEKGSSACIVDDVARNLRIKFVVHLGSATNNEAEITASLLGLSLLRARVSPEGKTIRLVADSEYFLKGATQYITSWQKKGWKTASREPVKNQGLWRTFLLLTRNCKLIAEHVRGHAGHPENEACDLACNWIRDHVDELAADKMARMPVPDELSEDPWFAFDASGILSALRPDEPAEAASLAFVRILSR